MLKIVSKLSNRGCLTHTVDTYNQNVALAARAFEIANMAYVQRIEAAVSEDHALAAALVLQQFAAKRFAANNLGGSFAHNSGSSPGNLAADGVEKFLA